MQRWHARGNNASENTTSVEMPPADTSAGDSQVDPFLMDFGTSVSVNEDLRRAIRSEIQELDDSVVASIASNKQEETVEGQLNKDLSHSLTEMRHISRCASDQLENANVHASFISGLTNTLQVELVQSTGVKSTAGGNGAVIDDLLENVLPSNSTNNGNHGNNKAVLLEQSGMLKKVMATMKQTSEEVDTLFRSHKSLVDTTNAINTAISSESLQSTLEEKRREFELLRADAQQELQRKEAMKATLQTSRDRCGAYAQNVADKTKQLSAMQRQYAAQSDELSRHEAAGNEKLAQRKQAMSELDSKLALSASQLAQFKEGIDTYENVAKDRDEKKAALEKTVQETDELLRLKKELDAQLLNAEKTVKESRVALQEAKIRQANACKLKEENDCMEISIIAPGKEELSTLLKKKEQLALEIGKHQGNDVEAKAREKEDLDAKSELRSSLAEELSVLKGELEGRQLKKQHFDRAQGESKENWEAEIKQHDDLSEKYQNAFQAEDSRIVEVHQTRRSNFDGRIEEAESEATHLAAEKDRYVEILLYGGDIIENAKRTIRQLQEDPIDA